MIAYSLLQSVKHVRKPDLRRQSLLECVGGWRAAHKAALRRAQLEIVQGPALHFDSSASLAKLYGIQRSSVSALLAGVTGLQGSLRAPALGGLVLFQARHSAGAEPPAIMPAAKGAIWTMGLKDRMSGQAIAAWAVIPATG